MQCLANRLVGFVAAKLQISEAIAVLLKDFYLRRLVLRMRLDESILESMYFRNSAHTCTKWFYPQVAIVCVCVSSW